MRFTDLFIRRPVMTSLVMVAVIIFGIAGYGLLPVSDLPNVDFPTINVSASLPGASPETMAASVATVLERQFSTVPGLDSMTKEIFASRPRIRVAGSMFCRNTPNGESGTIVPSISMFLSQIGWICNP